VPEGVWCWKGHPLSVHVEAWDAIWGAAREVQVGGQPSGCQQVALAVGMTYGLTPLFRALNSKPMSLLLE
jgi:hypothetical protein